MDSNFAHIVYSIVHVVYPESISEHINSLQYYKLTKRCSALPLMLASPLTCAVYPWPGIFNLATFPCIHWVRHGWYQCYLTKYRIWLAKFRKIVWTLSCFSDFVFKTRLVRLGFYFQIQKILYLNSQPADSQSGVIAITPKSQLWVWDTEKLLVTFSHAWQILVEFS